MKTVSVRQALQHVADYPVPLDDEMIQWPVHEHIARALYTIANNPDASVRGSMGRANKARKMILDRLVGRRRSGSHPATRNHVSIDFVDLTGGEIGAGADEED
jgi:hypothetical protein